ncbi:gliding motility-associated ABC transporter permease subunit GldF [Anditalea andensis]|uniref:ABC transporter permease n=1 Tax=Anditalea andensis TaxID=1048983 RepID=A0A074L3P9_9BACT|nr:gliding motility-associated ABC transporter permease subunit GldF [Anditalea andensis]KEO75085.1 ABC transporter permease [Anditalea andensis]
MLSLLSKEINGFFNQITGYLILGVFLIAIGLIVWVFPDTSVLEYGFADLEALFVYTPYVFVFMVPAITMKMIAEERRSGTWELLMTAPLNSFQIVLAKYLAAVVLVVITLLPTLVYHFSIVQLGDPVGNIDSAGFFGSFLGLMLIGAVFTAIGLFSSALTDNQIVAFVLGVFISFLFYFGLTALTDLQASGGISLFLENISLSYHYRSMSRGVIDSLNLLYFLTLITIFLMATAFIIRRR